MADSKVLEVRNISEASYILKLNRNGMSFKPGQHIVAGFPNSGKAREYSLYNGTQDEFLEILIREIADGKVSSMLRNVKSGDTLEVNGPYGFFLSNIIPPPDKTLLFIASGTGIAPFHSFIKTYPDSDYRIIHGIRTIKDAYDKEHYKHGRYITCTSQDKYGDFQGRLTDYLLTADIDKNTMIFLCGNNNMIQDAMEILINKGHAHARMFTEVYF